MKNPTLATIKKFIKESGDDLLIHVKSKFDGTEDGVRSTAETHFTKATREETNEERVDRLVRNAPRQTTIF